MIYCGVYLIKNLYKLLRQLKIVLNSQLKLKKSILLVLHPIKLVKNMIQGKIN